MIEFEYGIIYSNILSKNDLMMVLKPEKITHNTLFYGRKTILLVFGSKPQNLQGIP